MFILEKRILLTIAVLTFALSTVVSPDALASQESLSTCTLQLDGSDFSGPCGPLLVAFDHVPTVTLKQVAKIETGTWLNDVRAASVWAGTMKDAMRPRSSEPIELEIYAGEWGVLRTDEGWFPAANIRLSSADLRFDLFSYYQVSPSSLDQKIVQRAAALLSNTAVWNRQDDRKCPAEAATLSIYCAMEKVTIQVTGGFSHARPALQVVRDIIADRSVGRQYQHLLMDYNNDPRTQLSDVQSIFKEAFARMVDTQWLGTNGFVRRFDDTFQPG